MSAGIKTMPAPRAAKCADCNQDIHVGDPITELGFSGVAVGHVAGGATGAYVWMHRSCANNFGHDLVRGS